MLKLRIIVLVSLVAAWLPARRASAATAADLSVRATSTSFRVGVTGVYTVTITNNGAGTTDDTVTVTDTLSDGLSFLSSKGSNWTCSASGQSVACTNVAPLPNGSSSTLALSVSVGSAAVPSVTNKVTVAYAGDGKASNNTTTRTNIVKPGTVPTPSATATASRTATLAPGTPARTATPTRTATRTLTAVRTSTPTNTPVPEAAVTDLLITKTASGSFTVGGIGTYVLTVINVGAVSTTAPITVTDTLPSSLGFVAASGSGWACSVAGQQVTCMRSVPLASQSGSTILLNVSIGSAAFPSVTNIATVDYAGDTNVGNNTGRRPTTIRRGSGVSATLTPTTGGVAPTATATATPTVGSVTSTDLSIGKVTVGSFKAGSEGVYFITVTNVGAGTTNAAIKVTDVLPIGLTFVSGEGAGWTCAADGQRVTCTNSDPLTASSSTGITLAVSIGDAAVPTVTNTATVDYPGDTNVSNNTARKPTTVRQ